MARRNVRKWKVEAYTMLGNPQDEENIQRIMKYLNDPTDDNWDDIHGLLINCGKTLWQCVILIDRDFPRVGRTTDPENRVVKEWERIPSPFTVMRAIDNINAIAKRGGERYGFTGSKESDD